MKKKVLKVIILLLCLFYGNNVYAETIWPQMVTAEDYKMIIDGVSLKLYFFDYYGDNESIYNSYQNVLNGVADKTINIDTKKDVFEPKLFVGEKDGVRESLLNLNLDILDEDIKQMIMNEYGSEENIYVTATLEAKVKFLETPSNFSNIKKKNDTFLSMVDSDFIEDYHLEYNDSINVGDYNDIVLSLNTFEIADGNVSFIPTIDTDYITDIVGEDDNYLRFVSLKEDRCIYYFERKGFTYEVVTPESSKVNTNNPVTSNESTNNIKDQVVKVVNTGLSIGNYKYVISGLLLGFGMLILYKNVNKKKS